MKTVKNNMLKRRFLLLRFTSLLIVLFVVCLFPLKAQDSDFVTWNKDVKQLMEAASEQIILIKDISK